MSTLKKQDKISSPTLNTVIMVEETLQKLNGSVIKISELKKNLPKQINHNVLKVILFYLEQSNKIAVSLNGITWIDNRNDKLKKTIERGLEL